MKDGTFLAIDFFGGSGAVGQAIADIHGSQEVRSKTLMIDYMPVESMTAKYPQLLPYLDNGTVVYFQMDLYQFEESNVNRLVKYFLYAELRDVDWIHVSGDCSTFSFAGLSSIRHRTNEGAPLSAKAIAHSKTIHRFFLLARWYVQVRSNGLFTFESPEHGSFRSSIMVQDILTRPHWMLFYTDYCSVASEWLQDGLQPKKRTVILAYGLGEQGELPLCAGRECPMVVPGTLHHRLVLCPRTEGLHEGQSTVLPDSKAIIPKGLVELLWDKHMQWLRDTEDGYSLWCIKCGDGGDDLLMCDTAGCTRVQHRLCNAYMQPTDDAMSRWYCDLCCMDRNHSVTMD